LGKPCWWHILVLWLSTAKPVKKFSGFNSAFKYFFKFGFAEIDPGKIWKNARFGARWDQIQMAQ
jgi:hypothetical protein